MITMLLNESVLDGLYLMLDELRLSNCTKILLKYFRVWQAPKKTLPGLKIEQNCSTKVNQSKNMMRFDLCKRTLWLFIINIIKWLNLFFKI